MSPTIHKEILHHTLIALATEFKKSELHVYGLICFQLEGVDFTVSYYPSIKHNIRVSNNKTTHN